MYCKTFLCSGVILWYSVWIKLTSVWIKQLYYHAEQLHFIASGPEVYNVVGQVEIGNQGVQFSTEIGQFNRMYRKIFH